MTQMPGTDGVVHIARRLAGDLAEFAQPRGGESPEVTEQLAPSDGRLAEYDRRVVDGDLRAATRSRFVSTHYADAVESGVKALNECVRSRTGRTDDGDSLMGGCFRRTHLSYE